MKKFFENQDAISFKNVFIDDAHIYVSEKDLGERDFLEKFENTTKGSFESRLKIPIENITEFNLNEEGKIILLHFNKINNEDTTCFLTFRTSEECHEVKEYLISKTKFTGSKEFIGTGNWIKPALFTLISAILTVIFYMNSSSDGESKLTEVLGIGVIITLALAYWTYTRFKTKGKEVEIEVYKKF